MTINHVIIAPIVAMKQLVRIAEHTLKGRMPLSTMSWICCATVTVTVEAGPTLCVRTSVSGVAICATGICAMLCVETLRLV
jgi:hypothetical protein